MGYIGGLIGTSTDQDEPNKRPRSEAEGDKE
jgi:hypothetical protein